MNRRKKPKAGAPYHHGDLRCALLKAGLEILRDEGVEELSLRETARRVGVSHTAPYRHFADKDALLAAIAEEGFRRLKETLDETAQRHPDDAALALEEQALTYVRFAVEYRELFRIMFGGYFPDRDKYPSLRDAGEATFTALAAIIESGQSGGKFASGDPTQLALAAWSAAHGIATLLVDDQLAFLELSSTAAEPIVRFVAQRAIEGIRPA